MRLISFLTLFSIVIFNSNAQQLTQNKAKTIVDFKIKNIGIYVNGTFAEVVVSSNFNTENFEESYINAIIKVNSINTNSTKRDKHLLKDDFFDVAKFKEIKLVSTKIERTSESNYKLTGKLTIKETTKSIEIPLEVLESDTLIIIRSGFSLNRRDYNVGGRSWILSNTVRIQVVYTINK